MSNLRQVKFSDGKQAIISTRTPVRIRHELTRFILAAATLLQPSLWELGTGSVSKLRRWLLQCRGHHELYICISKRKAMLTKTPQSRLHYEDSS